MAWRKNMSENNQELSEEMVRRGWDRKKAEAQAEAFS